MDISQDFITEKKETNKHSSGERKLRITTPNGNMGKLPPQDIELEESLLGSILNYSDLLIDIEESLKADHFYNEANKNVYKAITSLSTGNNPIDISTVTAELRKMGLLESCGGMYYITSLLGKSLGARSLEFHSKIITQKFLQRELIRNSSETIADAYEDTIDVFDLIERHDSGMMNIVSSTQAKSAESIGELLDRQIEELSKPVEDGLTGVGSGFRDLDKITGGWQKTDLIIIAARPAMGKTAFVMSCARNAAVDFKKPVAVFSLEMSSMQLTLRLLSNETGIHLERLRKKHVKPHEIADIVLKSKMLKDSKIEIDDTASLSIFEFRSKCRRLKKQFGIEMIVVDYLQLMDGSDKNGKTGNRDAEIGKISRGLKGVAKELDIPVLALSQLSRSSESRPGSKRPMLSDLRESGNIEQDADMVLFLHRPEYYGITEDQNGISVSNLCEVIIAKNRQGVCDTVNLNFNGAFMKFRDWVDDAKFDFEDKKKSSVKIVSQVKQTSLGLQSDEDAPF